MPSSDSIARQVTVRGRVQGVGFRWHAQARARALGLCGSVHNRIDGSVAVSLEGSRREVEKMIEWLRQGPSMAVVREIIVEPAQCRDLTDFEVLRTER